ncbi:MAG: hydroxyacylglutathione hydrolase [Candidatus Krumholzibacteriia bacterium]|jgi:hydroxyacylglutathione hydrolase
MGDWKLEINTVGPLQMNSILLTAEGPDGKVAMLIDPGDEAQRLLRQIEKSGCQLTHLVATHGHFDHVAATAEIQTVHDLPLICHPAALPVIERLPEVQQAYGLPGSTVPHCEPSLRHGESLRFAGAEILVSHVPGHCPGHVMLHLDQFSPPRLASGDCLFHESVGRTDLPGGSFPELEKSIRECIYTLPDETIVLTGHGPDTTIGHEKIHNPFVQA